MTTFTLEYDTRKYEVSLLLCPIYSLPRVAIRLHGVYVCMYRTEEKKKSLCSHINKTVNVKDLTLKTEMSKEQDSMISLGVHSNSISLKILPCKLSASEGFSGFHLGLLQRSILFHLPLQCHPSQLPFSPQVLAHRHYELFFSEPKSWHWYGVQ